MSDGGRRSTVMVGVALLGRDALLGCVGLDCRHWNHPGTRQKGVS